MTEYIYDKCEFPGCQEIFYLLGGLLKIYLLFQRIGKFSSYFNNRWISLSLLLFYDLFSKVLFRVFPIKK